MSGFSFRGVYNAPIGTTSREASCADFSIFMAIRGMGEYTIRELGKTFQLRRRPSLSSTSDHCLIVRPIRPPGGCISYLFFESFNIHGEAREQQLSPPALLQWGLPSYRRSAPLVADGVAQRGQTMARFSVLCVCR